MGNWSNKDQWVVRERMLFIERVAWWKGVVNRGDVREVFGISTAQSSADLQAYQEVNPTALFYNFRTRRYEAHERMACVLHEPRLEEAVRLFLGVDTPLMGMAGRMQLGATVDFIRPIAREAAGEVQRKVFVALDQRRRLRVKYGSVKSGRVSMREIAPHALGHDGQRWHARAWCFENERFQDFVLSRIKAAEWPGEAFNAPVDEAWEKTEVIELVPNSQLSEEQRHTIMLDYGMQQGKLRVEVRSAMKEYYLAHWRVAGPARPAHLEILES